jgi:hypothetical protein
MAAESLALVAHALRAARPGLCTVLGVAGGRDIDAYMTRTVDAAVDLCDAMYHAGVRSLLQGVAHPERGVAAQIVAVNYASREPAAAYQPWAEGVVRTLSGFSGAMASYGLAPNLQTKARPA